MTEAGHAVSGTTFTPMEHGPAFQEAPHRAGPVVLRPLEQGAEPAKAHAESITRLLVRRRWAIALVALASAVAAIFWCLRHPSLYTSNIVVQLSGQGPTQTKEAAAPSTYAPGLEELTHAVHSSVILGQLVDSFGLAQHYHLRQGDPFMMERAVTMLRGRISAIELDARTIRVQVSDPDREMAAAIANSLFLRIDQLFRDRAHERLERAMNFWKESADRLRIRNDRDRNQLSELLRTIPLARSEYGTVRGDEEAVLHVEHMLNELLNDDRELQAVEREHIVLNSQWAHSAPTQLVLVRSAMRDFNTEPLLDAFYITLGALVLGALCAAVSLMAWHLHGHELRHFLTAPVER